MQSPTAVPSPSAAPSGHAGAEIQSTAPHSPSKARPDNIRVLNAKASRFKPFVHRVVIRVLQRFTELVTPHLDPAAPVTIEIVEVEAVMNPAGKMIRLTVTQRPARIFFNSDLGLQQACSDAFSDPSPPPGARAEDGQIHFILRSSIQRFSSPSGRQFWLELTAGLR